LVAAVSSVDSLCGEGAVVVAIKAKSGVAIALITSHKDLGGLMGEYCLSTRWNMTLPTTAVT